MCFSAKWFQYVSVQISFCKLFFFCTRKVWMVACSRVLRRSIINLTGPVELLQLEPHSAPGRMTLRNYESASCQHCICWGYKNTTDPESSKSSCSSRCTKAMSWRGVGVGEKKIKIKKKYFVPHSGFWVPTLKKNAALCLPTRHKGHNIFSTLSLCFFYSARCLFPSSLCRLATVHIIAILCRNTKCLFPDLYICCRDEGQFGRIK